MKKEITFRNAVEQDLDRIVEMLSDDFLGSKRECYQHPIPNSYIEAYKAITSDPNNELVVAWYANKIIGVQQIIFIPYITHQGRWRATIEGVRISSSIHGKGVGTKLIQWAIQRAKARGCHLIQLMTDKQRDDTLRFYERLGFNSTHEGFKMKLSFVLLSIHTNNHQVVAEKPPNEDLYKDALLTLISGNLDDAIVGHYGEYQNYHLFSVQIVEFQRIKEGEFNFRIKVQVPTWEEPSNKQSLDTITLEISPFKTAVTGFSHKDIKN